MHQISKGQKSNRLHYKITRPCTSFLGKQFSVSTESAVVRCLDEERDSLWLHRKLQQTVNCISICNAQFNVLSASGNVIYSSQHFQPKCTIVPWHKTANKQIYVNWRDPNRTDWKLSSCISGCSVDWRDSTAIGCEQLHPMCFEQLTHRHRYSWRATEMNT